MRRATILVLLVPSLLLAACSSTSESESADTSPSSVAESTTTVGDPTTTAAPTTNSPTTVTPTTGDVETTTTAAPTTAPPPTSAPAPATTAAAPAPTPSPAPASAPPSGEYPSADCVEDELSFFTPGPSGEVALYQRTLRDLGYDPGAVDGYFGQNTLDASMQEIMDNGVAVDGQGNFVETFPDDGAILPPAFDRLGISCEALGDF